MHRLTAKQFTWVLLRVEALGDCEMLLYGKGWNGGEEANEAGGGQCSCHGWSSCGDYHPGVGGKVEERLGLAKKVGMVSVVLVDKKDRLVIMSYQATIPANFIFRGIFIIVYYFDLITQDV
jgi:hypothetical protein